MLTGQAKTDYQREYMRRRRAEIVRPPMNLCQSIRELSVDALVEEGIVRPVSKKTDSVRPKRNLIRPANITENQWAYIQFKANKDKL